MDQIDGNGTTGSGSSCWWFANQSPSKVPPFAMALLAVATSDLAINVSPDRHHLACCNKSQDRSRNVQDFKQLTSLPNKDFRTSKIQIGKMIGTALMMKNHVYSRTRSDLGELMLVNLAVPQNQRINGPTGRSSQFFLKINSCVIPNSLEDLGRFLYRSPPELCLLCAPDSSATFSAICAGTIRNFMGHLHRDPPNLISHPELRNPPASHQPSTPEPSRTSSAFCPEPSAPKPFRTLSATCTRTLRNFISFLPRNPPEPHQPSAPERSGTLSAICTGTLRNFISQLPRISHLRRNPPEPHQQSAPEGSGTLRNLLRNLVLQLHRIAPELFWAKDPIASFAVGEKYICNFFGMLKFIQKILWSWRKMVPVSAR